MKSLINSKNWATVVVFMALSVSPVLADEDDFLLSVRNVTHTSSTIEFDLYLLDMDNAQVFDFAALQMGLLLSSSIYGSGTLTVSYSNTGSGLDAAEQFVGPVDVVSPLEGYDGMTLIRLMANSIPPAPPGAGTGSPISATGNGSLLAHFTITSSQSFTPNTRPGLQFCSGTAVSPLWPTVVYSYIGGNSTPLSATSGLDAIVDSDPLLNATMPFLYNVTGTGSYCEGGTGLPVGLDGSEINTTYALYRGVDSLTSMPGTGNSLSFGNQTEGTYTVFASNAAGRVQMTGQALITAVINTAGPPSATPTLCINTSLSPITHTTTGATGIGTPVNLPAGVSANWAASTITISGTPTASGIYSYSIPLTGGCGTVNATGTITVTALPGTAGSISGPVSFTPGTSGISYSVSPITGATGYIWSYSGTGVTINGTGASVNLDFSSSATAGLLSVFGRNGCGDGSAATLPLSPSTKTLTLTSVLLEGLYEAEGIMRQAMGESGPQWPAGIADHITVELHNSTSYSTVEFLATDVELSTIGSATLTIPSQYSGSYYVTIKHRNHIETVSALPVSFANAVITYSFDNRTQAFGNNLKEIVPGSGYYAIYGGDINHDGYVDSGDYPDVINGSFNYLYGYLNTDLNGDGWVDSGDYPILVNNNYNYVTIIVP